MAARLALPTPSIAICEPAISIRELEASDRRAVAFTFGHLGERSRYQRYLSPKPFLSARDMSRLLDVDHWHHDALIAYSPPPRTPIGIARYVRLDEFDAAELAIEVVDGWQRRGVGTALLAALQQRALRAGIRHFSVSLLRDNAGARALAAQLGRPEAATAAGSLVELRVRPQPDEAADSATAQHARNKLRSHHPLWGDSRPIRIAKRRRTAGASHPRRGWDEATGTLERRRTRPGPRTPPTRHRPRHRRLRRRPRPALAPARAR